MNRKQVLILKAGSWSVILLNHFQRKRPLLLTSHNMDEVDRLADRVAIMDYGKIMLTDTPYNLKNSIGEGDVLEIEITEDNGG